MREKSREREGERAACSGKKLEIAERQVAFDEEVENEKNV